MALRRTNRRTVETLLHSKFYIKHTTQSVLFTSLSFETACEIVSRMKTKSSKLRSRSPRRLVRNMESKTRVFRCTKRYALRESHARRRVPRFG